MAGPAQCRVSAQCIHREGASILRDRCDSHVYRDRHRLPAPHIHPRKFGSVHSPESEKVCCVPRCLLRTIQNSKSSTERGIPGLTASRMSFVSCRGSFAVALVTEERRLLRRRITSPGNVLVAGSDCQLSSNTRYW